MKLFEYNIPGEEYSWTGVYVVAKSIEHAITKLSTRYSEVSADNIIEQDGDILEIEYADRAETFKSGAK